MLVDFKMLTSVEQSELDFLGGKYTNVLILRMIFFKACILYKKGIIKSKEDDR